MSRGPDEEEIRALAAAIMHACHGHHMGEVAIALARVVGDVLSTIENQSKREKALAVFLTIAGWDATNNDHEEETLQ